MPNRTHRWLWFPFVVLAMASTPSAAFQFVDYEFVDANWSHDDFVNSGWTANAFQDVGEGDPAPAQSGSLTRNEDGLVRYAHTYLPAVYQPAVEGAIDSLNASFDFMVDSASGSCGGGSNLIGVSIILSQGASYYIGPHVTIDLADGWVTHSGTVDSTDYRLIDPQGIVVNGVHPDFSVVGSPITFGYMTSLSTTQSSCYRSWLVDNFYLEVNPTIAGDTSSCTAPGIVKISEISGGLGDSLVPHEHFANGLTSMPDQNGDGRRELVAGLRTSEDLFIIMPEADGSVGNLVEIRGDSDVSTTIFHESFGNSMSWLGDLDGPGTGAHGYLAVGMEAADGLVGNEGAVWIIGLDTQLDVISAVEIGSATVSDTFQNLDELGYDVESLGDLDGAGPSAHAIATGLHQDDDVGPDLGALFIIFLDSTGQYMSDVKIDTSQGGFGGALTDSARFGSGLAYLGDLDGPGGAACALAVGAPRDSDGGVHNGSVWILSLDSTGTCIDEQKISMTQGGFTGVLEDNVSFGASIEPLGDIDGDGVIDIAVGTPHDDGMGGSDRGAIWILSLDTDGTVKDQRRIGEGVGGFVCELEDEDQFGVDMAVLSDLDGDGIPELAVGADRDDDGGLNQGAIWILSLGQLHTATDVAAGSVPSRSGFHLSATPNPFNPITVFRFRTDTRDHVTLCVYDVAGRLVNELLDLTLEAGPHEVSWNGTSSSGRAVASGTYFVRLASDGRSETRPIALIR